MRSLTPSILFAALASMSLAAGACSKKSEKKKDEAATTSAAPGGATGEDGARATTGLPPAPRRMRSTEPGAAAQGEDLGPLGHRDGDGLGDEARMARRAEMRERFAEQRAKHDKDGDGELNAEERTAMRTAMMGERLKSIDVDGDGSISREEARAEPGRRRLLRNFDEADANQDQKVTPDELEAHIAERRANRRSEDGNRSSRDGDAPR
jgi:hypothetical protein